MATTTSTPKFTLAAFAQSLEATSCKLTHEYTNTSTGETFRKLAFILPDGTNVQASFSKQITDDIINFTKSSEEISRRIAEIRDKLMVMPTNEGNFTIVYDNWVEISIF